MLAVDHGPELSMVADRTEASGPDWGAAVRLYGARVVTSLLALRIPYDQAEELASQAWARLIEQERAGRLTDIRLPGLAIQQARFLALTWLKTRSREAGPAPATVPAAGDPEASLIARRDVEIALDVIARSSESARAVFHLLYDDPPPRHEEVAAKVGISVQRVRQIVCEVRKKIREALEARP